jgi:hypothetical protein
VGGVEEKRGIRDEEKWLRDNRKRGTRILFGGRREEERDERVA